MAWAASTDRVVSSVLIGWLWSVSCVLSRFVVRYNSVGVPPLICSQPGPAGMAGALHWPSLSLVCSICHRIGRSHSWSTNQVGHAAYVWQPGKYTFVMARSTGMDLVTIRVPGLISHYSRQPASLRSQLISPHPVWVLIPPTLLHRLMLPGRHPSGRLFAPRWPCNFPVGLLAG